MNEPVAEPVTHPSFLLGPETLPWTEVEARLAEARNYWVASVRRDGRPHTRPVWGMWFEDRLVLSIGGGYWMERNLAAHPDVSVHLEEAEGLVAIVEGTAHAVDDIAWKQRAIDGYNEKYSWFKGLNYTVETDGTIEVRPARVYAWKNGGETIGYGTRFTFPTGVE